MRKTDWIVIVVALALALFEVEQSGAAQTESEGIMLAQVGGGMSGGGGRRMKTPDRQKEMEKQFEEMLKYLGLEEKQEKEARALFKELNTKTKELSEQMRDDKVDRMSMVDSMREIRADYREKFDKLLTDEQRKKQEQWSREHARDAGPLMEEGSGFRR
jgi:Spy/CpxP family protein refolding chaperone